MYPYGNYGIQNNNQNMLPPQQILQANGKASIDALRLSPNSSVLIADQTQPIIWKCVSDSLGNVSATAFDVTPHKDEKVVEQENINKSISNILERLERLEKANEPYTARGTEPTTGTSQTNGKPNARGEKPTGVYHTDGKY